MDGMSIKGMERERKRGGYGFWVNVYERGEERIEWSYYDDLRLAGKSRSISSNISDLTHPH